jgi:hypothetical protein
MNTGNANVIVYIRQPLGPEQTRQLRHSVGALRGVTQASTSDRTATVMCVDYDPTTIDSQRILSCVTGQGVAARLVGM